MKTLATAVLILLAIYLIMAAYLYLFQRKLIYHPMPVDPDFAAPEFTITNQEIRLHGWVLHPGKPKAVMYFGGNAELISHRRAYFDALFPDYSVYLINYRGYGNSRGSPSEAGLFADALAIYDHLRAQHQTITAYGRSLGSGVAVYLASERALERLILLTPYDSVAAVGQKLYPLFPVKWLAKDRFDSAARASTIEVPVLIVSAEWDRVIPLVHTLALKAKFTQAPVVYQMISGATHNDIDEFSAYQAVVGQFLNSPAKPDDS